ncbi:hypothetical protein AgCh_036412 [Apium graveolens]
MPSFSSSSLMKRSVSYFAALIHQNYTILGVRRINPSSTARSQPHSTSVSSESIHLTDNFVRRMKELQANEHEEKMLRLSIEAGGCSGFQYSFSLDDKTNSDDRIFEREGVKLVVDNISYDFVKGSTVDYVEELIRSAFQVASNPSAVGGCSCKSSFIVG